MSQDNTDDNAVPGIFEAVLENDIIPLSDMPSLGEDDVLALARRIRLRQIAVDLNTNGGEMPKDPEERKIFLSNLKDLEGSAIKVKMVGAKERATAADREAVLAVQRMVKLMGERGMQAEPDAAGQLPASRPRPSISQAALPPIALVKDELSVGVDTTNYDDFMERASDIEVEVKEDEDA